MALVVIVVSSLPLAAAPPATPVISPRAGEIKVGTGFEVGCATPGARIRVWIGKDTSAGGAEYKGLVPFQKPMFTDGRLVVRAKAWSADGKSGSGEATVTYLWPSEKVATPVIAPRAGEIKVGTGFEVGCATPGAKIRVWIGKDTSAGGAEYKGPMPFQKSMFTDGRLVVRAKAWSADGKSGSDEATVTYLWPSEKVATPVIAPAAGEVGVGSKITLTSSTPGAVLRYTIGDLEPTANASAYAGGILVTEEMARRGPTLTVKAIAFLPGGDRSPVAKAVFTLAQDSLPAPSISPGSGIYKGKVKVEIRSTETRATIRYTTDGREPDAASRAYAGPFEVDPGPEAKVVAKAFRAGAKESPAASATYRSTAAGPLRPAELGPRSGTRFTGKLVVTISTSEPGGILDVVVEGDAPEKGKLQRTGSATIELSDSAAVSATVKAKDGRQAEAAVARYVRVPAPPRVTPGASTRFQGMQRVEVAAAHPADIVEVEVEGPSSQRSRQRGAGPFRLEITETATVVARSFSKGGESSPVVRVRLERETKTSLR